MSDTRKHASGLLRKAKEDFYAAKCLSESSEVSLWTIGFHVQQSVEKSLKSVLMLYGIPYPFTHDIASLIKIARKNNLLLPPDHENLFYLTPFGTLFRYEDEDWDISESPSVEKIIDHAKETVDWAEKYFDSEHL